MSTYIGAIQVFFPSVFTNESLSTLDSSIIKDIENRISKIRYIDTKVKRLKKDLSRKVEGSSNQEKNRLLLIEAEQRSKDQKKGLKILIQQNIKRN